MDNGDHTVTDTETGLMWQKDEAGAMSWEAALTHCENSQWAGYDDWRLPNRNELQSIVDYTRSNPAINRTVFPGAMSSNYWSSTPDASNTGYAWRVNFSNGDVDHYHKSNNLYVRAVRGGQ